MVENPEDHSTVSFFNRVEMAESITIIGKEFKHKNIFYCNIIIGFSICHISSASLTI